MKQLFSTMVKYWKTIATIFSICTTVVTSAIAYNAIISKRAIEEYSGQVKERSYEGKIDKLIASDSLKTLQLNNIEDYMKGHSTEEAKQEMRFKGLEGSYTSFLQAVNRLDIYVKYLETIKQENEKKNNGSNP